MNDYSQIKVPDMEHWSVDQILAVYDLCQMISATLMELHREDLMEKMMTLDSQRGLYGTVDTLSELQWPLPFDETPPFDDPLP